MNESKPVYKLKFFKKITVRIPLIILILLLIGIGGTVYYYSQSQNMTIIQSRQKAVLDESDVIVISVRNFMVPGHAPLAIRLFDDFSRSKVISDIKLYRINGETAFSDNKTLNEVNRRLGKVSFTPKSKSRFLKRVMNFQSDVVQKHGGDIDKFVGDELMAVFEGEDMVLRAILAAGEIHDHFRKELKKDSESVAVGIGINTGDVILVNMGSSERLDRTVIGDHVNLGARLCSAAGKNTVVISEFSYKYIKDKITVHEHNPIKVKGKQKPVKIYSLKEIT